jgi:hypothetical protein
MGSFQSRINRVPRVPDEFPDDFKITNDFQMRFSISGGNITDPDSNKIIAHKICCAKTTISYGTFKKFNTLKILADDLGLESFPLVLKTFARIPPQKDAMGNIIEYDTATLKKFIRLFETCLTETEETFFKTLNEEYTNFEEIKKFIILITYLDNDKFLHSLEKFSAQLIRDGKLQFP